MSLGGDVMKKAICIRTYHTDDVFSGKQHITVGNRFYYNPTGATLNRLSRLCFYAGIRKDYRMEVNIMKTWVSIWLRRN